MQRWGGGTISTNEKEFVVKVRLHLYALAGIFRCFNYASLTSLHAIFLLQAIKADHRIDGRGAFEYRPIQFQVIIFDSFMHGK